ncbi:hypothetical protein AB6802_09405 [Mesorhizobium sp. RCC_202]|uniref:hypothetical protein n=1 Tax=Mesorhizobium sp. RCC_202 TaxID=3239222 RepID=UPI003523DD09
MTIELEETAIEELAKALYWKMEHLDPTGGPEWDRLSAKERGFYTSLIEHLIRQKCLVAAVRSILLECR